MSLKDDVVKLVDDSDLLLNVGALVLKKVGEKLDEVVADSSNPFDDTMKALLWPKLEELLLAELKKVFL